MSRAFDDQDGGRYVRVVATASPDELAALRRRAAGDLATWTPAQLALLAALPPETLAAATDLAALRALVDPSVQAALDRDRPPPA